MRAIRIALAVVLSLILADNAIAQLGETPIRIVLPYPAGGVGDTAARMIADTMRKKFNRTVKARALRVWFGTSLLVQTNFWQRERSYRPYDWPRRTRSVRRIGGSSNFG